ncbi:MAG: hypothetical protein WCI67_23790, partial [Chloroflexales bacterium]
RGADRCALAIFGADGPRGYALTMSRCRGREDQEELVSRLVIGALAVACGLRDEVLLALMPDEDLFSW